MIRRIAGVVLLPVALLLGACTTTTVESFNVGQNTQVESAQISVNADFGRYDRLQAEEMGIFFPQDAELAPEEVAEIRRIFRKAFLGRLGNYTIVSESGPTTLEVQASLIDLREDTGAATMNVRRELRDVAQPGRLVFLMEMRDSQTSRTLARAADSAQAPRFSGDEPDWGAVEDAANHWAELFVDFLDENLGR